MRNLFVTLGAISGLFVIFCAVVFGVPAYLASGPALHAEPADFSLSESWLVRPEARPEAVWEGDWGLDVFIIPPMADTLHKHGVISLLDHASETGDLLIDNGIMDPLSSIGAVYMPGLRVPTQASPTPDWSATRSDLVAALASYAETDNRGRALAIYSAMGAVGPVTDLETVLDEAGAGDLADRLVLIISPEDFDDPSLLVEGFPNAAVLSMDMETAPRSWGQRLALPSVATSWSMPEDAGAVRAALQAAADTALDRASQNARKMVEPFGAIEIVREAPVNKPCEAGLRCQRD